jgi:hypothetical protein
MALEHLKGQLVTDAVEKLGGFSEAVGSDLARFA